MQNVRGQRAYANTNSVSFLMSCVPEIFLNNLEINTCIDIKIFKKQKTTSQLKHVSPEKISCKCCNVPNNIPVFS